MQGPKSKFLIFSWGNSFHTLSSVLAALIEGGVTKKRAGPLDSIKANRHAPVQDISPEF